jgi:hypothetical protein
MMSRIFKQRTSPEERAMAIRVPQRELSPAPDALVVSPHSQAAAFARIPDPRRVASVRYPLAAILNLVVVALLTQQTSVLAIAEWAGRQPAASLCALGFPASRTPCQSTLQRLLCKLDSHALADVLRTHFAGAAVGLPAPGTVQGVALDGKAQRGRLAYQTGGCPVHALSAFCHEHGVVVAQAPLVQGTEKVEAELSVAPAVIAQVAWPGRVLTGDALYCQRALCAQVLAAGGDYLLLVKDNQPALFEALTTHFDPPTSLGALPPHDARTVTTRERGHGRQQEVRTLVASSDLTDYLDWPGLAQAFRLERTKGREGHAAGRGALRHHQSGPAGRHPGTLVGAQARALGDRKWAAPHQGPGLWRGCQYRASRPRPNSAGLLARQRPQSGPSRRHPHHRCSGTRLRPRPLRRDRSRRR